MQAGLDHEQFGALYLNNRLRLLRSEVLFRGTINGTSVHPREVVKRALQENATAVILYHNHPGGNGDPSREDKMITKRLREALALIDVRLLDHLILSTDGCTSLSERGML